MDKKKFSCYYSKIESDEDLGKFLEENKNKIPKGVKVERASSSSINEKIPEDEIVIHASTFKLGLCLPFHVLIEEILSKHHLVPTQLAPNCWRVMFGIIALNQICKINLGWNEFCHCYAVKQNSGGTYYFSHKKSKAVLVTGLPKYEKGWKLDDLIRLKGDRDTLHLVPRSTTAADHKPKGFKSSDVNQCDIEKALEHPNRDWKYLVDRAADLELHRESKIGDESQSTLLTATGPAYSNLGDDVRSVEVVDLFEKTTTDVLSSPPSSYKKQKLMMHCDSNASLAANLVLPDTACSDYESPVPSEAAADKSKVTTDNVNHEQGSEDQETADQSKKNINSIDQLLKHNLFEEAGSQMVPFFSKFVDYCVNHIKELKAANERKDKELEELQLVKKKEPAATTEIAETTPGATDTESHKTCCKTCEEVERLKKAMKEMRAEITEMQRANISRPPTRMESPSSSSKNEEPLTSQSQNNHNIEGAAAGFTPPNMTLDSRTPDDQNIDIPGHDDINDQQQASIPFSLPLEQLSPSEQLLPLRFEQSSSPIPFEQLPPCRAPPCSDTNKLQRFI